MFASVPDKIYKLLILIGIALFVYYFTQKNNNRNEIILIEKEIIINNSEQKIKKLNSLKNELLIEINGNKTLLFIGYGCLFLGIITWLADETQEEKKKSLSKIEDKIFCRCQSCGMKFSSVRKYGTNNDQSNSNAFCEDCYQNGEFTNPELTLEQVKANAKPHTKGKWITRKHYLNSLNDLERFNKEKYFD